jgi:carbohydrate-selective porin OprB
MQTKPHKYPRMNHGLRRILVTLLFTTGPFATASAQMSSLQEQWLAQAQSGNTQGPASPAPAVETAPASGYLFSLVNPEAQSIGQTLANKGIYLDGLVDGVLSAVPAGGLRQGTVQDGEVFFGTDLDMKQIAGIAGAQMHISFDERYGPNPANYSGSTFDVPYNYGPQNFFLSELSWDQSLFDDHVRLLIGRINPEVDFDTSNLYGQFVTEAVNSNSIGYYYDNGAPVVPITSWGGRITLKPTADTYVRTGAYQSGDQSYLYNQTGSSHGFQFGSAHASGALVPFEAGYQSDFSSDAYPRQYDVGGYVDTSTYREPGRVNTYGTDRSAVYLQAQQMVWRANPKDKNDERGLSLFAQAFWSTSGAVPNTAFYEAGLWDKGPFAARPNDSFGVVFVVAQLSQSVEQGFIDQLAPHGGGHLASSEQTLEVNYGYELAPGMEMKPYLQYIQNPDQYGLGIPNPKVTNAVVVGFNYTITIPSLLGLPSLTRSN